jgi:muramoyltetrapeptide carboxypeptidase LdcA involved in peptidoglycan recycling
MATLAGWGLRPESGGRALDRRGFRAGTGAGRLADLDDALADRLGTLGVPVLGGLPIGPGEPPVPIGVPAVLDATRAVLTMPGRVRWAGSRW